MGSSLELTEVSCFFEVDQVLFFNWIAGSTQVDSPEYKATLHFLCTFCGSMRLHGYTIYQRKFLHSQTLFVFRWKTVWKMFSFCIFHWFQSSLTYHDICGPHWWLCSYSSQASAACKLKAECLFLICLELLFSLYCNFWHIFRSPDKVT